MSDPTVAAEDKKYGLRHDAREFPMMLVISVLYPCNLGCPNCPYTDNNSTIREFYRERGGDYFPQQLWNKVADEAGPYQAWMRCTGGGEPMMHPYMMEMVEYAKQRGARVWMNTNGTMFGPQKRGRERLRRVIAAGIDLIEFSMDAGDAATYHEVRPPIKNADEVDVAERWAGQVDNVRAALALRRELKQPTRVVVSIIRQKAVEGKLDQAVRFWTQDVGVDEVITRKFLSWDDNTGIDLEKSLDPHLYSSLPTERAEPCVWPFERLNIDTLGRVSLCGQDISFRTADLFPNIKDSSVKEVWRGERFDWYRRMHLEGRGAECWPCRGCSAWLAGVRAWDYGWLQVLQKTGDKVRAALRQDVGAEVQVHTPSTAYGQQGSGEERA